MNRVYNRCDKVWMSSVQDPAWSLQLYLGEMIGSSQSEYTVLIAMINIKGLSTYS